MNILHIHQDFPDGRAYPATKAVKNLIEECKESDDSIGHYVVSINRTSNPLKCSMKEFDDGLSIIYWCVPINFLYSISIFMFSNIIYRRLVKNGIRVDIIHGHKLTTEGLFSLFLSKKIRVPYVISIRGGSDMKNLNRFPECRRLFKKIYVSSRAVFFVSPWAKKPIEKLLNFKRTDSVNFPNLCYSNCEESESFSYEKHSFITVFDFKQYKRKGIVPLLNAISILKEKGIHIYLDIVGGGDERVDMLLRELVAQLDIIELVNFRGKITQSEVVELIKNSKALVLPSLNETFGMVYIEALLSNTPFIYMKGTGVDGYFDGLPKQVSYRLDDYSENSLVDALLFLNKSFEVMSENIMSLRYDGFFKVFERDEILSLYKSKVF